MSHWSTPTDATDEMIAAEAARGTRLGEGRIADLPNPRSLPTSDRPIGRRPTESARRVRRTTQSALDTSSALPPGAADRTGVERPVGTAGRRTHAQVLSRPEADHLSR